MDQSYQLYSFMLVITTLFTDIKSTGDFHHNWFDAQNHCLSHGLTIEKDKSDQPYWTGVYRRLTPWINILGCYPDSIESHQDVMKKTMIISSVGMCEEICHHENFDKFAVKMNKCLCMERNIHFSPFNRLPASYCNYTCEENSDDIYSGDCGGEKAYNIYETQGVHFNSVERCLSLQCSVGDTRFIPNKCSEPFEKLCENMTLPDNGYASSWTLSMKHCKKSHPSAYLLGDFDLNDPHLVCERTPHNLQLVWVGVVHQIHTNIDQGWEINKEERKTFLECQLCTINECCFKSCYDVAASSIYCETISDTSQSQETGTVTTLHGSLKFLSNHVTAKELLAPHFTTKHCDEAQLPSIKDTKQKSNASDNLALKISLPLILGFIILLLSAVGVIFYKRKNNMTKTDRTTNAVADSVPKTNVDSKLNSVQNDSYFVLEQSYQRIHAVSDSTKESPYNKSEEGVYDHLRDKQARKPEVEDTYQHASAGVFIDTSMSEYDTMADTVNTNQQVDASYDYSHQNANDHTDEHIEYGSRANNLLNGNLYDIAV